MMNIIIVTILGYSAIVTISIILNSFFDFDEADLLCFAGGPIFWIILLIIFLRTKNYVCSYSTYERYKKVEWPMHKFGNILLIRNKANCKFSTWGILFLSKKKSPKIGIVDSIDGLKKKEN